MQILFLVSRFPYPLKDGGTIATFRLISGLTKLQNQVHILCFNSKKHFIQKEKIPLNYFETNNTHLIEINNKPSFLGAFKNLVFSSKPYMLERFKSKNFKKKLKDLLLNHSFDIVQVEGLYMLQYVSFIKKISNVKVVYRPHNIEHQIWFSLGNTYKSIVSKLYILNLANRIKKYEFSIINKYDVILPISEEDSVFFTKSGNLKNKYVVPAGFDVPQNLSIEPSDINSIYFLGSLEWLPNLQGISWFINNCWNNLRMRHPELKLFIAGRNLSRKFVLQHNLEGIIWEGEIEDQDEFIKSKSLMIVPLFSGSGMRLKIIEAFLHGKPVISTLLGARGTKAVNEKHILLAENSIQFEEQIVRLIEDKNLYFELARQAFELASSHYNNEKICADLNSYYHSILKD
ncbi:MAG: glycosyltransferase family 4 protein [Bacteroidales bacterium]